MAYLLKAMFSGMSILPLILSLLVDAVLAAFVTLVLFTPTGLFKNVYINHMGANSITNTAFSFGLLFIIILWIVGRGYIYAESFIKNDIEIIRDAVTGVKDTPSVIVRLLCITGLIYLLYRFSILTFLFSLVILIYEIVKLVNSIKSGWELGNQDYLEEQENRIQ